MNVVALASAGNVSFTRVSPVVARVSWDGASDLTLYRRGMPGVNAVHAIDWDGARIDITSSCTITPNVSVVVPASAVSSYIYGLASIEVQGTLNRRRRLLIAGGLVMIFARQSTAQIITVGPVLTLPESIPEEARRNLADSD